MSLFLGLDIGTTSTIGIVIAPGDSGGRVEALASRRVTFSAPHPGWAEEDAAEWWANVRALLAGFAADGLDLHRIAGVCVTGMLPAMVLLDAEGQLIRPSIQQSDARCGAEVADMRAELDEDAFLTRAGNGVNQQLIAPRLRWLARHEPEALARVATVFGSYDYINWKLTDERRIEQNWALEAGFVDLATGQVADDLIALAPVPRDAVPPRSLSHEVMGVVSDAAARETGLAPGTPVMGGAADLIASALAAGMAVPGDVLLKFGGSVDVLAVATHPAPDARMYLDHHLIPGLWVPNGCMSTGGSALNWFVQTFAGGEAEEAAKAGLTLHQHLDQLAQSVPAGAEGLSVLPYFLGEKTPIHDPAARGLFSGITLTHGLAYFWRALLEGYAYAIAHHLEVLRDMGHAPQRYLVSDGGAQSGLWMQIVSDVLQEPLQTLEGHPGSCLGAAWVAAMGTGASDDWAGVGAFVSRGRVVTPDPANAATYAEGYRRFRALYPGPAAAG